MAELRSGEHYVLEIVENGLRRDVEVAVDFVAHHFALPGKFGGRKLRVHYKVGHELGGAGEIAMRKHTVDHRLLLGGVGIEFSANRLHTLYDMRGVAP